MSAPIVSHRDPRLLARADETFRRIDADLSVRQRAWLEEIPPTRLVQALDAYPTSARLAYVSPAVRALHQDLLRLGGDPWIDTYLRLVLLLLLIRLLTRPAPYRLPPSVDELLAADFVRILADSSDEPRRFRGTTFFDLGFCRGTRLPFGVQFGQLPFRLKRSVLDRAGLEHADEPWVNLHLRISHDLKLSADTRRAQFVRTAEFLAENPSYQGSFGLSWFTDPVVAEISPHLSYIQEDIAAGGAYLVPLDTADETTVANATKTSRTRRRLYEQGLYTPREHGLIWLRDDLIRWAKQRAGERFGR